MRPWIVFAACFVLVVGVAGGALAWWSAAETPPDEIPEVPFGHLDARRPWVRVTGTAHYGSVIVQRAPAGIVAPERTWHLYGFFPENETGSREIPILVRTQRPPERLVSFETMTIEGRLSVPTRERVPPNTEAMLAERTDYFFADGLLLLEPLRITSEDGVWEEPR